MSADRRFWPFTTLGTIVIVPLMAVVLLLLNYGFWWFVKVAGDRLLMLGQ